MSRMTTSRPATTAGIAGTGIGTKTATMLPILGCLVRAEEVVGENPTWTAVNDQQERFLTDVWPDGRVDVDNIPEAELRSIASRSAEAITKFLREQGFEIQLGPFQDENSFGVASVLKVGVEWKETGTRTMVRGPDGNQYAGVELKPGVSVRSSRVHPHPRVCIETQSGDRLHMTIADQPLQGLDLLARIQAIRADGYHSKPGIVTFPMVDLNHKVQIDWLIGLMVPIPGIGDWFIRQALQQTIFGMNEHGARVKSAAAMEVAFRAVSTGPERVVIDKPFYLWIERDGISTPIFVGYIEPDCWKDPGSLKD